MNGALWRLTEHLAESGLSDAVALIAAALLHEAGHIAVCRLCRIPIRFVRPSPLGAHIGCDCGAVSYGREICAAAAGPAANLLGFLLCFFLPGSRWCALFGVSCLALALFNLLPISSLDGGRILSAVLSPLLGCMTGARLGAAVSAAALLLLWAFSAALQLRCGGSLSLFLISLCFFASFSVF